MLEWTYLACVRQFKARCISLGFKTAETTPISGILVSRGESTIEPIEVARYIVNVIADKKGENIILMDIRDQTIIADYFVICSGTNERQLKAIVESIRDEVKKEFEINARTIEGEAETGWVLIDFVDIIVHAFYPTIRSRYDLEGLWSEAPVLLKMQ